MRLRAEGYQFANDLNTFRLPGYATMDLFVARELRELVNHLQVFAAVTNLLDRRDITGKNQTVTNIGAPLTVWGSFQGSVLGKVVTADDKKKVFLRETDKVREALGHEH